MFTGLVNWMLGILLCVISLAGLFVAAKGGTQDAYYFGLGLFILAMVGMAMLVRGVLDKADKEDGQAEHH